MSPAVQNLLLDTLKVRHPSLNSKLFGPYTLTSIVAKTPCLDFTSGK